MMHLAAVTLLVRDYDQAIAWFRQKLGFALIEDSNLGGGKTVSGEPASRAEKRWVMVGPSDGQLRLLLAQPANVEQARSVGAQAGGRVFLFLHTDDFARDHAAFRSRGVIFLEEPRYETYGIVAVFEDISGNRWDMIERKERL
jgi:catechol 2,3-dioxygenase-like lactoylglutathione lyase family enzyme